MHRKSSTTAPQNAITATTFSSSPLSFPLWLKSPLLSNPHLSLTPRISLRLNLALHLSPVTGNTRLNPSTDFPMQSSQGLSISIYSQVFAFCRGYVCCINKSHYASRPPSYLLFPLFSSHIFLNIACLFNFSTIPFSPSPLPSEVYP